MKIHASIATGTVASLLALASTGCIGRTMVAFDDHPRHALTTLEVFETRSYFVYTTREHKFFSCTDAGDKLVCKPACGGNRDVQCPSELATRYGGSSNTR